MTEVRGMHVYDPLDPSTFEVIAYNAVGRGSEVGTLPAYRLTHSTANSGWSVGFMQWDFGQPGRGHKVGELLDEYQRWAPQASRFSESEVASLASRLRTRGSIGNQMSAKELDRINEFLRSDPGRDLVGRLDREQVQHKWRNVGEPLSRIPWLAELRTTDPGEAAEIVAMACKRFNQGEARGRELVRTLGHTEMSSEVVSEWVATTSVRGLSAEGQDAIVSGRDNALAGVRLVNRLELADGVLGQVWRDEVYERRNGTLSAEFSFNTTAQLLDAMMRSPTAGARILSAIDEGRVGASAVISGSGQARHEMARVELDRNGVLSLRDTRGFEHELTQDGWRLTQPQRHRRSTEEPDYMERDRARPLVPNMSAMPDVAGMTGAPHLDRLAVALSRDDDRAFSDALAHLANSPQMHEAMQWGRGLLAAEQAEELQQVQHQQQMQQAVAQHSPGRSR